MKRFLIGLGIAAVTSVLYVTSAAGAQPAMTPSARQFAGLQKQVRVLKTNLRALQERTRLLKSQMVWTLEMVETVTRDRETCSAALIADEFQNTWSQIDHLAGDLGAAPIFGPQTAVSDRSACAGLGIPRPALDSSVAPTVAPFNAFILGLHGG